MVESEKQNNVEETEVVKTTKEEKTNQLVSKPKEVIKESKMEESKVEDSKPKEISKESKMEEPNVEESKVEEPKIEESKKVKKEKLLVKDKAIANAFSLPISPKQSKAICKMIRRKTPSRAIVLLEEVAKGKRPVKMTGLEVPHQKGKGVSGARFPKTAAINIIGVLKQLKANCSVNGIEEPVIRVAMSNKASAPFKRGGKRAKRASLYLEAVEKTKLNSLKK